MLWKDVFQVSLSAAIDHSIIVSIKFDSQSFFFTAIYGCNDGIDRRRLWSHLNSIHNTVLEGFWFLVKDLNVIMDPSESLSSFGNHLLSSDMKDFIEACRKISIFDHAYLGPFFAWSNKHQEGFLARKFDRALINESWLNNFTHSLLSF